MDPPADLLGALLQLAGREPILQAWRQVTSLAMGVLGGIAILVGFLYLGVTLRLVALMERVRRT